MHRSGTSAVAAALESFGFGVGAPGELMAPDAANPSGYFELQAIADLNDDLLVYWGGKWDSPPRLPEGWQNDPEMAAFVRRIMHTMKAQLPREHWLIKDPRLTLTLPVWRRAVLDRCAAVLVVRDPMEVAWSIALRNGVPTLSGLALWSAYNRAALRGLGGLPVYVCSYDELVADPHAQLAAIATSLAAWGELPGEVDIDQAAARVRPELRRSTWPRDSSDSLERPGEIDRLEKHLAEQLGPHDAFGPSPTPAAPWEQALLGERRAAIAERHAVDGQLKASRAELESLRRTFDTTRSEASRRATELMVELDAARAAVARLEAELANLRGAAPRPTRG